MKLYSKWTTLFACAMFCLSASAQRLSITADTDGVILWPTNPSVSHVRGGIVTQWRTDITNIVTQIGLSNSLSTNGLSPIVFMDPSTFYLTTNPSNFSTVPQLNTSSNSVLSSTLINQASLSNSMNSKLVTVSNDYTAQIASNAGASTTFVSSYVANSTNRFATTNNQSAVSFTNQANAFVGAFTGNGGGVTNIPASGINSNGTLFVGALQSYGSVNSVGGVASPFIAGALIVATGSGFLGNGLGVSNINGANITSGVIAPARLGTGSPSSGNFLRGDGAWVVPPSGGGSGSATNITPWATDIDANSFSLTNAVRVKASEFVGAFTGDGGNITNISTSSTNATQISGAALTTVSNIVSGNTISITNVLGAPAAAGTSVSFNGIALTNLSGTNIVGQITNNTTGNAATATAATTATNAMHMTNGIVSAFTNSSIGVSSYSGTQYTASTRNTGASWSTYAPILGGSASALADTPPQGQEVWANQPYPVIGVTTGNGPGGNSVSDNETNVISILADWRTNNVISGLTNQGVRVVLQLDSGHWYKYRLNGHLQDNTNRYPNGLTNATRIAHTNGVEVWADAYFEPRVPLAGTTTRVVGLSGQDAYDYPIASDPNGGDIEVPVITPDTVAQDVEDFYRLGLDGFLVQDMGTYVQYAGAENQAINMFSYAANFPRVNQNLSTETFWGYNYGRGHPASPSFKTNFNDHALTLSYLIIPPFSPTLSYGANGLLVDSGWPIFNNQSGVGFAMAEMRPSWPSFKYFRDKTTHPWVWGEDTSRDMSTYTYTDWKGMLSVAAIFNANVFLTMPAAAAHYPTNTVFQQAITNSGFLSIHQDYAQRWPTQAVANATNSVWIKRLNDPSKVAVGFFNEDPVNSTNLTVTWAMLGWASNNIVANMTDAWTNSNRGSFTNSITVTVGPTNAELVVLTMRQAFDTLNFSAVTNRTPGLVGADGAVLTLGLGANLLAISDGIFSFGTSGASGLASVEIHTPSSGNYKTNAFDIDDQYIMYRSKADGFWYQYGNQANANGVVFTGVDGEYLRSRPGSAIQLATNTVSRWPTAAATPGGCALINSNGTLYVFTSLANSTAWAATNKIAP